MAGASALNLVENAGSIALSGVGVIRARTDVDSFRFGSGAGSMQPAMGGLRAAHLSGYR